MKLASLFLLSLTGLTNMTQSEHSLWMRFSSNRHSGSGKLSKIKPSNCLFGMAWTFVKSILTIRPSLDGLLPETSNPLNRPELPFVPSLSAVTSNEEGTEIMLHVPHCSCCYLIERKSYHSNSARELKPHPEWLSSPIMLAWWDLMRIPTAKQMLASHPQFQQMQFVKRQIYSFGCA